MNLRDTRKPYELSEGELQTLIAKFEKITDTKFDKAFADQVNNFIGIYRQKILIERDAIKNRKIKRELTQLEGALRKVSTLQNDKISYNAQMALFTRLPNMFQSFIDANDSIEELRQACQDAIASLGQTEKSTEYSLTNLKPILATELARELNKAGVEITAYREGTFGKCLEAFLKAIKGEAGGEKFNISIREDLFPIIKQAKDDYATTERFVLLKFR
jgi:uncharacterized protein YqeY